MVNTLFIIRHKGRCFYFIKSPLGISFTGNFLRAFQNLREIIILPFSVLPVILSWYNFIRKMKRGTSNNEKKHIKPSTSKQY